MGFAAPRFRIAGQSPFARYVGATTLLSLPLFLWWLAFRPGIMSADSLGVWQQVVTGEWHDIHPPLYVAVMWLSNLVFDSPSGLTVGQQVFLASGIAGVSFSLIRLGTSRSLTWAIAAAVSMTPMVGAFSTSLWKDVPYTAAYLHAGGAVIEIVRLRLTESRSIDRLRLPLIWLGGASIGLVHWRQNGILTMTGIAILLFLVYSGVRRVVAIGWGVLLVTVFLTKAVVYPLVGVQSSPPELEVASLLHDLAAVAYHHPEVFDADDREVLESLAPFETWRSGYVCYSLDRLYYRSGLDYSRMSSVRDDIVVEWRETILEASRTIVGHRLCAGSVAWRPMAVDRIVSVQYKVSAGIDENDLGLRTVPVSDTLHDKGVKLINWATDHRREWYLWRAPAWIYGVYACLVAIAARYRRPILLTIGVPLVAQQASVIAINPSQDARYMMGPLMLSWLLVSLVSLLVGRRLGEFSPGRTTPGLRSSDSTGPEVVHVERCASDAAAGSDRGET